MEMLIWLFLGACLGAAGGLGIALLSGFIAEQHMRQVSRELRRFVNETIRERDRKLAARMKEVAGMWGLAESVWDEEDMLPIEQEPDQPGYAGKIRRVVKSLMES
jgi:uncharacterized protein (DUF2342 family)